MHSKFSFSLAFQNSLKQQEYRELLAPLLKDICSLHFGFFALLLIPIMCKCILDNLYPLFYIGISLFMLIIALFLLRKKLQKCLELLLVLSLALILGLYLAGTRLTLGFQSPQEAFYMGYGFALIQRILDARISRLLTFIVFNITFTLLKFTLIGIPEIALGVLIICLEVFSIVASFIVERAERRFYNSSQSSTTQLLELKKCLDKYLPNPVTILSPDNPNPFFSNDSFKKSFECPDFSQVQTAFQKLELKPSCVEQNRELLGLLGYNELSNGDAKSSICLWKFLELISKNIPKIQIPKPLTLEIHQKNAKTVSPNDYPNGVHRTLSQEGDFLLSHQTHRAFEGSKIKRQENNQVKKEKITWFQISKTNVAEKNINLHQEHLEGQSPNFSSEINHPNLFKSAIREEEHAYCPSSSLWKVTIFPINWDNHSVIGVIFNDITHQRTLQEFEIADKNKDMVIAMVSHELRTPLSGLLGMLNIAQKKLSTADVSSLSQVSNYLDTMRINNEYLLNLVNSILDFSQLKNNKLTLEYTQFNLSELLEKIRPLFDHFCTAKNLYLNVQIDQNVPQTIFTDKGRLAQILINLVANAFKFTFSGGVTIRVSLEQQDQQQSSSRIRVSVEDTGLGIRKEDLEKLFQFFGKLEHHRKINSQGVGLGLTLSNTLAKLLDPTSDQAGIQVKSEVDKGSVFTFTIENKILTPKSDECELFIDEHQEPLIIQKKMSSYRHEMKNKKYLASSSSSSMESRDRLPRRNVEDVVGENWCLLVDDNPFNLIVAENILAEQGYKVKVALNGREAIQKVQEHEKSGHTFKFILMDCEMPVMNGYEATKLLRKMMEEQEIGECPIVAVTAHANDERQKKLFDEVGMSGFLMKPLQVEKLEEILKECKDE